MPSHGRNNNGKKHRHQKNKPDEPMLVPRLDADPYPPHVPRPSQADSFSSRASTSTARGRMPYDPSPSLGGPAESWRTNHDHSYDYPIPPPPPEIYSHGHGSGLDMYNPRDADWRHGASEPYRDEYYDRGYPVSYPPEPPSWGMAPAYDRPAAYWPPADDRVPSSSHRTTERRPEPETLPNWRHDRRREKDPQTWQPDNGWEPRPRPSKGKAWEQPSPWETPAMREDRAAAAAAAKEEEDRMWQPAPGWNASGKGESSHHGRSQTNQRNLPPIGEDKVPLKSSKKASKSKAHRRQDEEDLNNWSKRDAPVDSSPEKQPHKKHRRSSYSRSRSPVPSHYSPYSPRGRSRSRSASPANKRRRRNQDYSPRREYSPTAMDGGYRGRELKSRYPDSSPSRRSTKKRNGRRHSVSSVSSVSRSRSPSPAPKPKAVHRLPSATSVDSGPLSYSRPLDSEAAESPPKKKSKKRKKAKDSSQTSATIPLSISPLSEAPAAIAPPRIASSLPASLPAKPQIGSLPQRPEVDATIAPNASLQNSVPMRVEESVTIPIFRQPVPVPSSLPPKPVAYTTPTVAPSPSASLPKPSPITSNPVVPIPTVQTLSSANATPLKPTLITPTVTKKPGFKPIAQAPQPASSLRHFFPGDDTGEDQQVSVVTPPSQQPAPHASVPISEVHVIAEKNGHHSTSAHVTPTTSNGDSASHEVTYQTASNTLSEPPSPVGASSGRPVRKSTGGGSRDLYTITSQVGEGTFGKVYKARNTVTNVFVALKRIRMEAEKDGFPVTAMREIKLLQSLKHENVIHLYEMMVSKGAVYMVFEYMDHDLTGVLSQSQFTFTGGHLKSLCLQMFSGLAYLHRKGIIHRDIKGSNILLNNQGELKLADFGLARFYHKRRQADYTNRVITLWYRPPELLYGATVYGPEVDMWSAGCIMLELYTKKPIFQGNDEIHQLDVISDIMGTPLSGTNTGNDWEDVQKLPWFELLKPKVQKPMRLYHLFSKWMPSSAIDIAARLLAYEPGWRMSAEKVINYGAYWNEDPLPEKPVGLATLEGEWHELESKRERAKKRGKKSETVQ